MKPFVDKNHKIKIQNGTHFEVEKSIIITKSKQNIVES